MLMVPLTFAPFVTLTLPFDPIEVATFVSALQESITKGVGSLVDADMNEESTKLQALQVQQQLGVQSLGIANQNSMLILKLFGG